MAMLFLVLVTGILAITGCSSPSAEKKVDADLSRKESLGYTAFRNSRYQTAANLYRDAVHRAMAINDQSSLAHNSYNLAACLFALGQLDDAATALRESAAAYEKIGGVPAENWLMDAKIAFYEKDNTRALKLIESGLAAKAVGGGSTETKTLLLLLKARIMVAGGDREGALQLLKVAGVGDGASPTVKGQMAEIHGLVYQIDGDKIRAAEEFDKAVAQYKEAGLYTEMAEVQAKAAREYELASSLDLAWDRYYQAASSLWGQGNYVAALKLVDSAMAVADKVASAEMKERSKWLFSEIKRDLEEKEKNK